MTAKFSPQQMKDIDSPKLVNTANKHPDQQMKTPLLTPRLHAFRFHPSSHKLNSRKKSTVRLFKGGVVERSWM